ncbi:MAG: GH1 family beta-glucosidase [Candidatus Krumholzibacteriia bacterium]
MPRHSFPEGFRWGVATSAAQIEGARDEAGRGESIWDRFAAGPGTIGDGSSPSVACDHYHRRRDDVGLMAWLGLDTYRFSIAWPRVVPDGIGAVSADGLDFYDALVDDLLGAGIEPFPTLYHWDLPQALQDRGGWASRDTAEAFVDYCVAVTRRLGDRVRHWTTHNEPWCVATLGHEEGQHAPGHRDPAEALRVAHHLLLSHGWAAGAIRRDVPAAEVGIVLIHTPAYPATDSEADREAARWFDGFFNRWYLDPVFRGSYPADAVADRIARGHLEGPEPPFVQNGDLAAIASPLDFLGLNYYSRVIMRAGPDGRPTAVKPAPAPDLTAMGWEVFPEGLFASLRRIHLEYRPARIDITENGAAYDDPPPDDDGSIEDHARIAYVRDHLLAVRRAIAAGVPVRSYFLWSLLDNFEWSHGYEKRFGLFAVDRETRQRTRKASATWYRDVVAANAVVDAPTPSSRGESRAIDP